MEFANNCCECGKKVETKYKGTAGRYYDECITCYHIRKLHESHQKKKPKVVKEYEYSEPKYFTGDYER